jgi:thioredoxin reductase
MSDNNEVVIVGGAPVGLVIALRVAQAGMRVKVFLGTSPILLLGFIQFKLVLINSNWTYHNSLIGDIVFEVD